jgi:hypothetical protein
LIDPYFRVTPRHVPTMVNYQLKAQLPVIVRDLTENNRQDSDLSLARLTSPSQCQHAQAVNCHVASWTSRNSVRRLHY